MSTPDPQQQPSDPPPESPTVSFDKSATPPPAPPFEQPPARAYDPMPGQAYDPRTGLPIGPPPTPPYSPPAYNPPYGYGPQPYYGGYPGYAPPSPTNGMAIASLVLGILWLYWLGSILALVFGYIARQQVRERGDSGGSLATAGIVLGWIGVGTLVVVVLFFAYALSIPPVDR
jgi:Domain of unknown function (DUF4190)